MDPVLSFSMRYEYFAPSTNLGQFIETSITAYRTIILCAGDATTKELGSELGLAS
jgi:hypothetical protein